MAGNRHNELSEEEKNRREYGRNRYWNCLKKTNKNRKNMEKNTGKICLKKTRNERVHKRLINVKRKIIPVTC